MSVFQSVFLRTALTSVLCQILFAARPCFFELEEKQTPSARKIFTSGKCICRSLAGMMGTMLDGAVLKVHDCRL